MDLIEKTLPQFDEIIGRIAEKAEEGEPNLDIGGDRATAVERRPTKGHSTSAGERIGRVLPRAEHQLIGELLGELQHIALIGPLIAERGPGGVSGTDCLPRAISVPRSSASGWRRVVPGLEGLNGDTSGGGHLASVVM